MSAEAFFDYRIHQPAEKVVAKADLNQQVGRKFSYLLVKKEFKINLKF